MESWFKLWVNGEVVGFASGSRLASEFDVTKFLKKGKNTIAVRVRQWSAGSYLEDQDQWWLPGIFRDVTLLSRPEGSVEDFFVHAGYDGKGKLKVDSEPAGRVKIPELGVDIATGEEVELDVEPWTAEAPRLYTGELVTDGETVQLEIGFRTVRIEGDQITVNGVPIKFYGVNRHEFAPKLGRALDKETMEHDVRILKQNNVNAVRTSHYPPHPYFLTLCDRYGLWVVLECDLETHGFSINDWKLNPSSEEVWRPALLNRMERTIERDKNHPSIIIWSLGNESDVGENTGHMAEFVRSRDPSRPIHYEGDARCKYVDIWSQMYTPHAYVELVGKKEEEELDDKDQDKKRRGMPFMLCEFAHAMGNGPGGVKEYIELFDKYPRLQGGFVWEFVDHGIPQYTKDGRKYYAYGGDFGEEVNDGNFITDGLMFPDRKPSPGMLQYRRMIQPVVQAGDGLRNRCAYSTLDHLRFTWEVEDEGEVIDQGELQVGTIKPGGEFVPNIKHKQPKNEGFLIIRAALKHDTLWAKAGHEVAWVQKQISRAPLRPSFTIEPSVSRKDGISIGDAHFNAHGQLVRLGSLPAQLELDIWRAPTDNDRHRQEAKWRKYGLDRMHTRVDRVTVDNHKLTVDVRFAPAVRSLGLKARFTWKATDQGLLLAVKSKPVGKMGVIPRLGVRLRLPKLGNEKVEWFGLGPGESYPDSVGAVRVGKWKSGIEDLQTPYVFPQENGTRRAVRWAEVSGEKGGIRIEGVRVEDAKKGSEWVVLGESDDEGESEEEQDGEEGSQPWERDGTFGLTVRQWTGADLDAARHTVDLTPSDFVYINIDTGAHGLGTESCGPRVLPQYELRAKKREFAVLFKPVSGKESSCVVQ